MHAMTLGLFCQICKFPQRVVSVAVTAAGEYAMHLLMDRAYSLAEAYAKLWDCLQCCCDCRSMWRLARGCGELCDHIALRYICGTLICTALGYKTSCCIASCCIALVYMAFQVTAVF